MDTFENETWRYTTCPVTADQVYLVVDSPVSPSRWMPMQSVKGKPGVWTLAIEIDPVQSRVRYFTAEGSSFLNCGNVGLARERVEPIASLHANSKLDRVA